MPVKTINFGPRTITAELNVPTYVVGYNLTASANPGKYPIAWTIQGSTDGITYVTIDTRQYEVFSRYVSSSQQYIIAYPGLNADFIFVCGTCRNNLATSMTQKHMKICRYILVLPSCHASIKSAVHLECRALPRW